MATYYCDPASGSNTSPYDTWAKAATNLQTVVDLCTTAPNTIKCKGTQTLALGEEIDFTSAAQGTSALGYNEIIGHNTDESLDGSQFTIDANSAAANCVTSIDSDFWRWSNVTFTNATAAGVYFLTTTSYGWQFYNCKFTNHAGRGLDALSRLQYGLVYGCLFKNNLDGCLIGTGSIALFSTATGNGIGFQGINSVGLMYGCLSYNNSTYGFYDFGSNYVLLNCVAHNNLIYNYWSDAWPYAPALLLGCRSTGQVSGDIGINCNNELMTIAHTYSDQNGGTDKTGDGLMWELPDATGASTNVWAGTDTDYGYVSSTTPDFNLDAAATLRRIGITTPIA